MATSAPSTWGMAISIAKVDTVKIHLKCILISNLSKAYASPMPNSLITAKPEMMCVFSELQWYFLCKTLQGYLPHSKGECFCYQLELLFLATLIAPNRAYHTQEEPSKCHDLSQNFRKDSTDSSLKLKTQQMTCKNQIFMDFVPRFFFLLVIAAEVAIIWGSSFLLF